MRSASARRIRILGASLDCVSFDTFFRTDDTWRSHCSWTFHPRGLAWRPTAALQKRNDRLIMTGATRVSRTDTYNTILPTACPGIVFLFFPSRRGEKNQSHTIVYQKFITSYMYTYILHFYLKRVFRTPHNRLVEILLSTSCSTFRNLRELFIP